MDEFKALRSVVHKKWQRQEEAQGERPATVRLPMNVYLRIAAYAADRRKSVAEALSEIVVAYLDEKKPPSGRS